jgi:hypothetical protein
MKKYSAIITAVALGLFALGTINSVHAAGAADALLAKEISKEDAAKNYPPPAGKNSYPEGITVATSTGGFYQSPYSSRSYDCRKLKHGALVLDESVKKVFLRP